MKVELGLLVTVRIHTLVVFPYELPCHMLVRQLLNKVRKQFQERLHSLIGICGIARMKALLQNWIVQLKQPIYAERITLCTVHIFVSLVPAHLEILSNLPV